MNKMNLKVTILSMLGPDVELDRAKEFFDWVMETVDEDYPSEDNVSSLEVIN